jgi:DNA helicase HerA-like ATPase
MTNDFEIGRVVAVDTAQVTIELNKDLKALTRTTYEGVQEVGRINSYVIMPVGARRLVAMVTRVSLTEEAELRPDRTAVTLPAARRMMKATLIGTLDGRAFTQGISLFPTLDNPVHLVTTTDLRLMFDAGSDQRTVPTDPKKPGFCIPLGESAVFEGYPIRIDPDAFFGKHAAVIGSTGSGKSCTIASLLQSILEREEIRRTNFVILDTNGEYRSAFQEKDIDGSWKNIGKMRCLYVPSDPSETASRLAVPYWFLNAEDFVRLFRAREGLQAPVLLRALRVARAGAAGEAGVTSTVETLRTACAQILSHTQNDSPNQQWALPRNIHQCCSDGLRFRQEFPQHVADLGESYGEDIFPSWELALQQIQAIAQDAGQQGDPGGLGATRIQQIRETLDPVVGLLNRIAVERPEGVPGISADQPVFFERTGFLERALETAMREQAESGNPGRVREACGPMFLRIRRFFEDPRFGFLFDQRPDVVDALAVFLRDILGLPSAVDVTQTLSSPELGQIPFYDRQRAGSAGHHVVILDLSLLATEVLANVTALIGRLVFEFLQRMAEYCGEGARGSLPVVLVLEEAQNYIGEPRHGEEASISRVVFERIAREGRKHGLGLVISSQRPSELSKTVLSQCSSFVVHRLQNPEDLRYFKEIVPGIYADLLNQLPALVPQTALVLGECVRAPALVKIREAKPLPRSRDPRFYEHWVAEASGIVPVEEICARWEGREAKDIETLPTDAELEATPEG